MENIFLDIQYVVLSLFRQGYIVSCLCRMTSSRYAPILNSRGTSTYTYIGAAILKQELRIDLEF